MLKSLLTALAVIAALAPSASAGDSVIKISGVIAVEQSRTPGIPDDGVALIRPADGSFVSSDDWGIGGFPELSPDGRTLATAFEGCVWLTHVLVAPHPNFAGSKCQFGSEPRAVEHAWSPDGRHLAFIGETGAGADRRWDVYVMNADETGLRRVTTDGAFKTAPQWRVDGKVVFVEDGDVHSVRWDAPTGSRSTRETTGLDANAIAFKQFQFGISSMAYISRPNNFTVPDRLFVEGRAVLTRPPGSLRGVAWQPGPTPDHLVVAVQSGGDSELLVINRSGTTIRALPVNRPARPDWGVDGFASAPAGGPPRVAPGGDPRDPGPATRPPLRPGGTPDPRPTETRADRKGRVALTLGCPLPVACRIAVGGRVVTGRRGGLSLPARRYRVRSRTTRRVRYRLPAPARRLLRKRGQLRVRFTITGAQRQVRPVIVRRR